MAEKYERIQPKHRAFIERQHMFFTASAAAGGHVNLSPKGLEALRVLSEKSVVYLDQTGSGNETAAHINVDGRLTIMFCAFEGSPMILRLYGRGRVLPRGAAEYVALLASQYEGKEPVGARQMVMLDVEMVLTSCGYAVPHYKYVDQRPALINWAESNKDTLEEYRRAHNEVSLDGFATGYRVARLKEEA